MELLFQGYYQAVSNIQGLMFGRKPNQIKSKYNTTQHNTIHNTESRHGTHCGEGSGGGTAIQKVGEGGKQERKNQKPRHAHIYTSGHLMC